jgi:hypothetical protein
MQAHLRASRAWRLSPPAAREGDDLLGTKTHPWTVDHWEMRAQIEKLLKEWGEVSPAGLEPAGLHPECVMSWS